MLAGTFAAIFTLAGTSHAQNRPDWTEPFPPFRIAGNLYYVGSKGLANYLVTTPEGHILINSDLEESVPLIRASVEKLGFKFSDIKILLISHAHWDHDAGSAAIKRLTGARYMVMDGDVSVVESGGMTDFHYGNQPTLRYPPAKVDHFFLGTHGGYFDLDTKYARLKDGAVTPFIDPAGYNRYVADREKAFRTELAKQKKALRLN